VLCHNRRKFSCLGNNVDMTVDYCWTYRLSEKAEQYLSVVF
jgi:hypothetical protein